MAKFIYLFFLLILSTFYSIYCYAQSGNEIIEYSTKVDVKYSVIVEEKSFLIQINDQFSDWISDIQIPFNQSEKIEILESSIIGMDGKVLRTLKRKEIETLSDIPYGTLYEDSFVKRFSLKWDQYPYRIRYRYRSKAFHFLNAANWTPLVYLNVPVKKAKLVVELPEEYKVKIKQSQGLDYDLEKNNGKLRYEWVVENILPVKQEMFAPPLAEVIPSVTVSPESFLYDSEGSRESWQTYGQWVSNLNQGLDELTPSEKSNVDLLIKGLTDKKEITRKLYHYVQDNTQYINVAIDFGGLKPYPASYVCENRYGDCKALTNYMKALLKYVNIESYFVDIYAGDNPVKVNRDLPGQQFNHVILAVPVEEDTIWLENTSGILPFDYLGTFTQNREALLINHGQSKLVRTPTFGLEDVQRSDTYHFKLNREGDGELAFLSVARGKFFEDYRYLQTELNRVEQKDNLGSYIPVNNAQVTDWSFYHADRDSLKISLKANLKVSKQIRKIGSILLLKPLPFPFRRMKAQETRNFSVRINYPVNRMDSIVYDLSLMGDYSLELPDNVVVDSEYGSYSINFSLNEGSLLIERKFQLFSGDYPQMKFVELYHFFEEIETSAKSAAIIFNPK